MSPTTQPAYVEYGSLATAPGPLHCSRARLHGFWLEGDRERIAALCRRVLSEPTGGEWIATPVLDHVVLTFGVIDEIKVGHDYARRGNVTERQVGIWVPVVLSRRRGRIHVPRIAGAFIPYMWLDNPLSVASGREVYGYPKAWGWATRPGEPPRGLPDGELSTSFTLDVYGLRKHDPKTKAQRERLLEVTPQGGDVAAAFEPVDHDGLGEMLAAHVSELGGETGESGESSESGVAMLGDAATEEALLASLRRPELTVNQLFLKQFRAAGDNTRASQQQIVRAGARPTRYGEHRSIEPHRIEIADLDSHPLCRELGLCGSPQVRLPFTVEMDFTVDEGALVWDATA